jgi:hypothetical protein
MRRIPWWAWTLVGIAVVAGVVAALGGFSDVRLTKVRTIALGGVYAGQEVDSRVLAARIVTTAPGGQASPTGSWLEIELESTDHTDAPVPIDVISLRASIASVVDGVTAPDAQLTTRDGGTPRELQPGVPTRFAFLWKVPSGAIDDGERIAIGIFEALPETGRTVTLGEYGPPEVQARVISTIGASA